MDLVFSSLEMWKRLIQTKVYYKSFLLCLKSNDSQSFRKRFSPVCMLLAQPAPMNVFMPCDKSTTLYFMRVYCCSDFLSTTILLCFWYKCFEKSLHFFFCISTLALHNIEDVRQLSTLMFLIPKLQTKAVIYYTCQIS